MLLLVVCDVCVYVCIWVIGNALKAECARLIRRTGGTVSRYDTSFGCWSRMT